MQEEEESLSLTAYFLAHCCDGHERRRLLQSYQGDEQTKEQLVQAMEQLYMQEANAALAQQQLNQQQGWASPARSGQSSSVTQTSADVERAMAWIAQEAAVAEAESAATATAAMTESAAADSTTFAAGEGFGQPTQLQIPPQEDNEPHPATDTATPTRTRNKPKKNYSRYSLCYTEPPPPMPHDDSSSNNSLDVAQGVVGSGNKQEEVQPGLQGGTQGGSNGNNTVAQQPGSPPQTNTNDSGGVLYGSAQGASEGEGEGRRYSSSSSSSSGSTPSQLYSPARSTTVSLSSRGVSVEVGGGIAAQAAIAAAVQQASMQQAQPSSNTTHEGVDTAGSNDNAVHEEGVLSNAADAAAAAAAGTESKPDSTAQLAATAEHNDAEQGTSEGNNDNNDTTVVPLTASAAAAAAAEKRAVAAATVAGASPSDTQGANATTVAGGSVSSSEPTSDRLPASLSAKQDSVSTQEGTRSPRSPPVKENSGSSRGHGSGSGSLFDPLQPMLARNQSQNTYAVDLERQMKALQMALDGNEVNGAERNSKEEQQPQQQQQQQGSSGTQQAEASTKNAEEDGGYFSFTPQMSRNLDNEQAPLSPDGSARIQVVNAVSPESKTASPEQRPMSARSDEEVLTPRTEGTRVAALQDLVQQLTTLKAQVSLKRSNSSLQRSDSNSTAPPPQTTTTQPPLPTASIAGSISAATSDADPNSRPVSRTNSKRASFAPEPTVVTSQAPPSNSLPQLKAQAVQILASMDSQAQFTPPPALEPLNEDSDEQNSDDEEDDDCDTPTNPNIHRTTFMFGRRSMNRRRSSEEDSNASDKESPARSNTAPANTAQNSTAPTAAQQNTAAQSTTQPSTAPQQPSQQAAPAKSSTASDLKARAMKLLSSFDSFKKLGGGAKTPPAAPAANNGTATNSQPSTAARLEELQAKLTLLSSRSMTHKTAPNMAPPTGYSGLPAQNNSTYNGLPVHNRVGMPNGLPTQQSMPRGLPEQQSTANYQGDTYSINSSESAQMEQRVLNLLTLPSKAEPNPQLGMQPQQPGIPPPTTTAFAMQVMNGPSQNSIPSSSNAAAALREIKPAGDINGVVWKELQKRDSGTPWSPQDI